MVQSMRARLKEDVKLVMKASPYPASAILESDGAGLLRTVRFGELQGEVEQDRPYNEMADV